MDLFFLAVGGSIIALATVFTAIGRSIEMQTLVTAAEKSTGKAPGSRWEDGGSITNMIGALFVAFGAILSSSPGLVAVWIWSIVLVLLFVLLVAVTLFRRQLMGVPFFKRLVS